MVSEDTLLVQLPSGEDIDDRFDDTQNPPESFSRKRRRLADEWTEEAFPKPAVGMAQNLTELNTPRLDDTAYINKTTILASNPANKNVAPFLAKHIRDQYGSMNRLQLMDQPSQEKKPNSKYCYRHRPDLKCRRQADEPSMDQMQRVGVGLFLNSECCSRLPPVKIH